MDTVFISITDYLLRQSWQIATLFAVVAVVCLALKKKTAHLRYLLWLLIIAKCLVPSLITVSLAILPEKTQPAVLTEPVAISEIVHPPEPVILSEAKNLSPPAALAVQRPSIMAQLAQIPPKTWFSGIWLGGVGLYSLIVIIKAVRFNRRLGRERKPLGAGMQKEINELIGRFGVRAKTRIWLLDGIGQPFVWGMLRGAIFLPANFGQIGSREHRRGILMHEIAHALRFDAAVNVLQAIAQAIFWFHPLVWWANRNIRAEREKCCDETAIARLSAAPKVYSSAIVDTLIAEYQSTQPVPSLAIAGPIKNIEDRIKTIMKPGKKFYNRPTVIAIITILLLAIAAVPTTIALTHRQAEKPEEFLGKDIEKASSEFIKTLPNGMTVELVGICENPSAGKQWWRPDGSRLDMKIITEDKSNYTSEDPGYEMAFKFSGQDFSVSFKDIKGSKLRSGLDVLKPEGLRATRVHIKPNINKTKMKVGVAAGKWKTVAKHTGRGTTVGIVKGFLSKKKVIFSGANETKKGVVMTVSDDFRWGIDTALFAVDKTGAEHEGYTQTSLFVNNMQQQTFVFGDVLLEDIKEFQFRTRPYEWTKFKNISLKPKFKTDMKVEGEDKEAGYAVTGRVLTSPGGEAATGAIVNLWQSRGGKSRTTEANTDGIYIFKNVKPSQSEYVLRIKTPPGLWTDWNTIHVSDKNIEDKDLYLTLPQSISGFVRDIETAEPVPGANIRISTSNRNKDGITTDEEGKFCIYVNPWFVTLFCDGTEDRYYPNEESKNLEVQPGQNINDIEFTVISAPKFTGQVLYQDRTPAENIPVDVELQWSGGKNVPISDAGACGFGRMFHLKSGTEGRFTGYLRRPEGFRDWHPNINLKAVAWVPDRSLGGVTHAETKTDTTDVVSMKIVLEKAGSATIRVIDPDGKPIEYANVTASDIQADFNPHFGGPVQYLGNGQYCMSNLIPGLDYYVAAQAFGYQYRPSKAKKFVLEPGEDFDAGTLTLDWWGKKAVPALVKQLHSPDMYDREGAARLLGSLGEDAIGSIPVLVELLRNDPHNTVRYTVAEALDKICPLAKEAVPDLIVALEQDEGGGVKREAAKALGLIGDLTAVPALNTAMNDKDRNVRKAAAEAIKQIEEANKPAVQVEVGSVRQSRHEAAVAQIEKLGGKVEVRTSETGEDYTEVYLSGYRRNVQMMRGGEILHLKVDRWEGGDEGIKHLKGLANLKKLRIRDVEEFTDEGMAQLKDIKSLESLILDRTQVTDDGLIHLKNLTNLEFLGLLRNSQFTDKALDHLRSLTNLKKLRLDDTQVTDEGLQKLKQHGLLTGLELLALGRTQITDVGLAYLKGMSELKWLYMESTNVTDSGLAHLAGLTKLEGLILDSTQVTGTGLEHLKGLTNLDQLVLGGTKITDVSLFNLKGFTELQSLFLENTNVTDTGLSHLNGLTNLNQLYLTGSQVSNDGYMKLKRALPNCGIYWEKPSPKTDVQVEGKREEEVRKSFSGYVSGKVGPDSVRIFSGPIFYWSDIPVLLELAESDKVINDVPASPISSHHQSEGGIEGMVALWIIEGLRTGQMAEPGESSFPTFYYHPKYRPLNPMCLRVSAEGEMIYGYTKVRVKSAVIHQEVLNAYQTQSQRIRSLVIHQEVLSAYQTWWQRVHSLEPFQAAQVNPLALTDLNWFGHMGKPKMQVEGDKAKTQIEISSRFILVPQDSQELKDFFEQEGIKPPGEKAQDNSITAPAGSEEIEEFLEGQESAQAETDTERTRLLDPDQVKSLLELTRINPKSKLLTSPKVLVLDGESATLSIMQQVAYISGYTESDSASETQPITDTIDHGVSLEVLPKITDNLNIKLDLDIELTGIAGYKRHTYKVKSYKIPQIEVTKIVSEAMIPDGKTLLLAGNTIKSAIFDSDDESGADETPKELLILITPTIIPKPD